MIGASPMSEIIPSTLKDLGEKFYLQYLRNFVLFNWNDIVGELNAKKMEPLYIEFKILHVYCKDSSWQSNVYALKDKFIQMINEAVKEEVVKDIVFSRTSSRNKKRTEDGKIETLSEYEISRRIGSMVLTDEELKRIKESNKDIDNVDLREAIIKAAISRIKLEKYRLKTGWHKCKNCEVLCPAEDELCERCRRMKFEQFERRVITLFREVPFLSYAQIKNDIEKTMPEMIKECRPERVNSIKSKLIQYLCGSIDLTDLKAVQTLVMLFKGARPQDVTKELINSTLYELRYDLPTKGRYKVV